MKRIGRPPKSLAARFWQHVAKAGPDDCWLWKDGCFPNGYGRIVSDSINSTGNRKTALAHRVAWELTNGPIPEGKALCHTCDTRYPAGNITYRRCCNPAHVRPGDALLNMHDAISSKRLHTRGDKRGTSNGRAILTEPLVLEIRARNAAGDSAASLARAYGISTSAMHELLHRTTWAHI